MELCHFGGSGSSYTMRSSMSSLTHILFQGMSVGRPSRKEVVMEERPPSHRLVRYGESRGTSTSLVNSWFSRTREGCRSRYLGHGRVIPVGPGGPDDSG